MRTKFKLLIAFFVLAVIVPLGAKASSLLSSDSKTDVMTVTLSIPQSQRDAMRTYLEQIYGSDVTTQLVTQPAGGGSPYEIFTYPYGGSLTGHPDQRTITTRAELKKIMSGNTAATATLSGVDPICHSLFSWYFFGGKELEACGQQGDTVTYSDLSAVGFNKIASSWFRTKTSGNVDLYSSPGFTGFLTTEYDDDSIFPGWLNDKASSANFSI